MLERATAGWVAVLLERAGVLAPPRRPSYENAGDLGAATSHGKGDHPNARHGPVWSVPGGLPAGITIATPSGVPAFPGRWR
jgi:hypothetical protein